MATIIQKLLSQYTFYDSIYVKLASAVITFFIVVIIGKLIIKFIAKLLDLSNFDYNFKKITGIEMLLAERIDSFGKTIVYFIAAIFGLNYLDITKQTYVTILAFLALIFILSIILGVKDFIPNWYRGLMLRPHRYVKEGDKIRLKNVQGTVKKMRHDGLMIELKNKDTIFIPNLSISAEELRKSKI